jgi:hypothetical protein
MKYAFLLVFGLAFYNATGQSLFLTQFENCNTSKFHLDGRVAYSKCDMNNYLNEIVSRIDSVTLYKIRGQISFQIIIDESGNPCCQSLKNELNGKGCKVDFKELVDNIDLWSVPKEKDVVIRACTLVKIVFRKNRIEIERYGIHADEGFVRLSYAEMSKK